MSVSFSTKWTQIFPPPGPRNGVNLPSQAGKVFVVTGGLHGLGYELSKVLYGASAKVYIVARSKERGEEAISSIKSAYNANENASKKLGSLKFTQMDLMDLESVKTAAREFLASVGRVLMADSTYCELQFR